MSAEVAAAKVVAVASDKRGKNRNSNYFMFNNNAALSAFDCVYGCYEQSR